MSALARVSAKSRIRVPLVLLIVGLLIAAGVSAVVGARPAAASTVPAGFQDTTVLTGLNEPTNVAFAGDGRVFVAEKSGVIEVFHGLADPLPAAARPFRLRRGARCGRAVCGV